MIGNIIRNKTGHIIAAKAILSFWMLKSVETFSKQTGFAVRNYFVRYFHSLFRNTLLLMLTIDAIKTQCCNCTFAQQMILSFVFAI